MSALVSAVSARRSQYALSDAAALPDAEIVDLVRSVAGEVPNPLSPPPGCTFHPRCPHANARCRNEQPLLRLTVEGSRTACHAVEESRI